MVTPSESESKLDPSKHLLGVPGEDEYEKAAPSDAESIEEEESVSEMAIKLEKEDLESMMTRAMTSAVAAVRPSGLKGHELPAET